MNVFFENFGNILANLPDNPWAIVSLVVILIGFLAYMFFKSAPVIYRVFTFIVIVAVGVGITYLAIMHDGKRSAEGEDQQYSAGNSGREPEQQTSLKKPCPPDEFFDCGLENQ